MFRPSNALGLIAALTLFISPTGGQDRVQRESVDLTTVYKIKTAEFGLAVGKPKSQIADLAFNLTDRFGPRLTNSPQFQRSAEWAVQQLMAARAGFGVATPRPPSAKPRVFRALASGGEEQGRLGSRAYVTRASADRTAPVELSPASHLAYFSTGLTNTPANEPARACPRGIRLATMHRVKALEFEHVIIVAANEGVIPLKAAVADAEDAVARRDAETGERSLLYVALTRARRSATVTGYGTISPFLELRD